MSYTSQQIVIYGAGGFAREVAWLIESCSSGQQRYEVAALIDDNATAYGQRLNDIPVMSLVAAYQQFPAALAIGGIGAPHLRQRVMEKAAAIGFAAATLIHPQTASSRWVTIGTGTVICAGCILTTNITLGQHVQINLDCTIGHDVVMDDYVTLAPGVHVSGQVRLGKRVYVGTGAVIINGTEAEPLIIEDDVTIGAGACVTRSVTRGETVVGIPAKPMLRKIAQAA
jgi:sugar O-acyltransferase (sialic acid O-acetyltransferase NeuD family)